ncbi:MULTISPECIES: HlyD family secretion protein [unclassified Campylobacter]|uniref:HlyD family secretion protein n=1 Tax=unclassified Campylobacter TaxID=2593542 RepID=UPI001238126B|nr:MULTISPECIES: HlyD family efflux transporter periplasmic adaptor subunit [unclassified Campylobacter]KAA6227238.1 HlyD family efflux transporter periplasmic adaptor subunit [Campylobacter sp. LR286c]KAA6227888.1 HlyD family efflux transporter periplasmic adaptor subunit [Campylobacter sp. LR185c]KAA6228296.1 HlyD family efflux transporter periplasmic adaptor subunit [Campylobacter sp. LR196d]KAA6229298.1 HlyD family efflux transporter periplasmic adaptor subunit [Campylobacter sp. LR291e]KA
MKNFLFSLIALFFMSCSLDTDFDAMGIFESDEILVSSEISGIIEKLNFKEGDELKKGELVGNIDNTQLRLEIKRLESEIVVLENKKYNIDKELAPLREQIKKANREKLRQSRLVSANSSTQKSLDDATSEFEILSKDLDAKLSSMTLFNNSLMAQIEESKTQIEILQDRIEKSLIKAPIDGVVLEKYAYEGELSNAQRAIFKIADIKIIRLKAYLIDTDLTRIKLGDEIRVFSDYGNEYKEYKGVITWISSKAEFTPKTIMSKDERKNLVYAIKVDVQNDGFLKIGSYGEIKLK